MRHYISLYAVNLVYVDFFLVINEYVYGMYGNIHMDMYGNYLS